MTDEELRKMKMRLSNLKRSMLNCTSFMLYWEHSMTIKVIEDTIKLEKERRSKDAESKKSTSK